MSADWIFQELRPGNKDRQPTQGEFFATDAIRSVAEALVRETIQNSLDAGISRKSGSTRVRFHLAQGVHAAPGRTAGRYFEKGWHHFAAEGNGLDDRPEQGDDCPYLLIEDFGTTGLTGDVLQWLHVPGKDNPFYYFFRTEGRSGKGEEDRGRWGIGKYVFPRSSRINAFIALTVRHDDSKRLLMGQAVLKSHTIGNKYFTPDGDFGLRSTNGLVLPVSEEAFLDRFSEDFNISRTTEPGLSIVVPWVDEEITSESLLLAAIEDYFYPIFGGVLEVEISGGDRSIYLNRDSLVPAVESVGGDFAARMLPLMRLAIWARDSSKSKVIAINPTNPQRPVWAPTMISAGDLLALRARMRAGEPLAVSIPLTVREKHKANRESSFSVYLQNDGSSDGAPVFIRDGIIISDVRGRPVPGVRSIVVIDDPPLAALLGDSENPAHTQWQKDREHFRNKYVHGKSYLDFVTHSVFMLIRYLNETDDQPDRELLREIFFAPKPADSAITKDVSKPRKRNKGEVIKPDPKVEPRKRRYTLSKVASGFTITKGHEDAPVPQSLTVRVAYDRRRRSPLGSYSPADFRLSGDGITVDVVGVELLERDLNRLVLGVLDPDFRITVTGFDENRDLYVDVAAKEDRDDPKA